MEETWGSHRDGGDAGTWDGWPQAPKRSWGRNWSVAQGATLEKVRARSDDKRSRSAFEEVRARSVSKRFLRLLNAPRTRTSAAPCLLPHALSLSLALARSLLASTTKKKRGKHSEERSSATAEGARHGKERRRERCEKWGAGSGATGWDRGRAGPAARQRVQQRRKGEKKDRENEKTLRGRNRARERGGGEERKEGEKRRASARAQARAHEQTDG